MKSEKWVSWLRELKGIAQIGLTYGKGKFDIERYKQLQRLTAELAAAKSGATIAELQDVFAKETGYATPKVDVRGAMFVDDKILMVREIADEGRWTLPGGWADVGDSPSTAVTKELFEESGFKTKAVKLIALFDRDLHAHPKMFTHTYKLFFLCEKIGGKAKTSIETSEVAFFPQNQLPADLSIARVLPEQIKLCFEHYKNREQLPLFD